MHIFHSETIYFHTDGIFMGWRVLVRLGPKTFKNVKIGSFRRIKNKRKLESGKRIMKRAVFSQNLLFFNLLFSRGKKRSH